MKKLVALLLAVMMVMGLFSACSGNGEGETQGTTTEATTEATTEGTTEATTEATTEGTTEGEVAADSNASTQILENIWGKFGENEQFFVMGGNVENYVDGKPGNYNMEYAENLTYNLLIPADQLANVDEAGFMQHAMNANNFTAGVVHVTSDAKAFAEVMRDAIKNNMWMCGFPDTLVIAVIDSEYVLVSFGINDAMTPFTTHLGEAYADAEILYNEPVAE